MHGRNVEHVAYVLSKLTPKTLWIQLGIPHRQPVRKVHSTREQISRLQPPASLGRHADNGHETAIGFVILAIHSVVDVVLKVHVEGNADVVDDRGCPLVIGHSETNGLDREKGLRSPLIAREHVVISLHDDR